MLRQTIGGIEVINEDLELYHHGVIGMRWGVRNAETQARYAARKVSGGVKKVGSKTKASVRKRSGVGEGRKYKDKEDLINRGSAKDLHKNRRILNTEEKRTARDRLNIERDFQNMSNADFRYGARYLDRAKSVLGTSAAILGSYVTIKNLTKGLIRRV